MATDGAQETPGEHSSLQGTGEDPPALSTTEVDSDSDPQRSGVL